MFFVRTFWLIHKDYILQSAYSHQSPRSQTKEWRISELWVKLMFMENRPSHTHFHYWLTTNCLIWCLQYCNIYVNYVLNGCIMIITVAAKGQLCSSLTKDQNFSPANRRIVTTIRSNTTTCRRWKNWTWIYSSPGVNDSLKLKSNKNN